MKNNYILKAVPVTVAACLSSIALAQVYSTPLVVTASRLAEEDPGPVVELTTTEEIDTRQQDRLQDILTLTPGLISTSTSGQAGQVGSVIIRGLSTRYNPLLVDGVRISDSVSGGTVGNILGNLTLGGGEQVEVIKGGQNIVHGNAAFGGVIGVANTFSEAPPALNLSSEYGSFEYNSHTLSSSGTVDQLSYYLNASRSYQEHDAPLSSRAQAAHAQASLGAQYSISDDYQIRITARGGQSDLTEPGHQFGTDHQLYSLQLLSEQDHLSHATVIGFYDQEYHSISSFGTYLSDYRKWSLTSDVAFRPCEHFTLHGGVDLSWNEFQSSYQVADWNSYAAYLSGTLQHYGFTTEIGARAEYNTEYYLLPSLYAHTSYAWEPLGIEGHLGATYAARAPSLLEFGAFPSLFQAANPDLHSERVLTLEGGFIKTLGDHELTVNAYAHFFTDAITSRFSTVTFASHFNNADGTSEIYGLETSLKGSIAGHLHYQLAWNYTMKNDVLDIPRNTLNADLSYQAEDWTVGLGVGLRSQASFGGFRTLDSHIITRLYGEYTLSEHLKIHARAENLFNESYELDPWNASSLGAGSAFYGGVTVSW